MNLEDFNRIDPKNLGGLPFAVKAVLLGVVLLLLVAAGYWFLWQPALEELNQSKANEAQLREVFLSKKKEAVNLPAYRQQMVDIERTFGALLRQLPNKSQMDGLLTDINQAGLERGLEFELFKPGQEKAAEFYAEMPISIKITGGYYDLGAFAVGISKLSRIVTLNDLKIVPIAGKDKDGKEGQLAVEAVAKTFRYLDASEIAPKKEKKTKRSAS
jgi:type IV pilus assembly protein PilO